MKYALLLLSVVALSIGFLKAMEQPWDSWGDVLFGFGAFVVGGYALGRARRRDPPADIRSA